ncbi:hypothetical protein KIMH_00300 [Bombiscardovia apis]|uniref:ABC transporter ATP-binding protein n=1 Tax=Bombiscardovia apis TaxID=2932182 RepID=A0ABN6SE32_9BIFI|nr:ATP-binding cassette domain-containing protein [Bombiscardovia apis]BDR53919.1 hypothetical protein KIMH_00300 [Bombiscardovia apis]
MISKDLLKLPGADLRRSITIGVLQAVGALAEIFMLLLAIFGLGQLFGLGAPIWIAIFVTDPLTAIIWLLALAAIKCLCVMVANQTALKISGTMGEALSQDLYLSLFNPEQEIEQADEASESSSNQSMAMLSTEGIKSVCTYFTTYVPALVQTLLMIVVAALVLIPLNWAAGIIVILGMIALPFSANMLRSKEIAQQVAHMKKYDHVGVRFEEALRGLSTLKIFHADQREAEKLSEDSEGFRKTTMELLAGQLRSLIGSDTVIYLAVILATVVTILMGRANPLALMTAVAIAAASVRLFTPERQMVYLTHAGTVALKHGKAIMKARANRSSERTAASAQAGTDAPQTFSRLTDGIHLQDLSYTYPSGFQALESINLDLPAQGRFGLVGASGSGKSTLASLLAGRLTGYQGSLTIDGQEISTLGQEQLIGIETLVKGSDHIFTGSVRSNLDPAGIGYSDDDLMQALYKADLQDLVADRGGLDSPIEQAGSNLSGGQRQRLSIARAILRHSPVYIFDEATSAVDRDHDQALSALMDELGKEALVVTITHRLAGVRNADRIVMLDQGHIVQSGTFAELTAQDGPFAQQWQEQNQLELLASANPQTSAATYSSQSAASQAESEPEAEAAPAGAFATMKRMAQSMRPLMSIELKAIVFGTLGHLFSTWSIMCGAAAVIGFFTTGTSLSRYWQALALAAVVMALLRGPMAYEEQLFNHQMAFSTLRNIRNTVFDKMRTLAPAKLQERGRGNLVTVITNDIELLEIFYAHTLSPITIAALTAVINTIVLAFLSPRLALVALICYLIIGLVIPLLSAKPTFRVALAERNAQGSLHSLLLETLEGRRELIGLGASAQTRSRLIDATDNMLDARSDTEFNNGWNNVFTQTATLLALTAFAAASWIVALEGQIAFPALIVAFVGFASSFAPLVSVARLGSGLQPTLAAARRVFSLMDEKPAVQELEEGTQVSEFTGISARDLSFAYTTAEGSSKPILDQVSFDITPGTVVGVQGDNGAGKSTLIDLLMRFRERSGGQLTFSGEPIDSIRTADLRNLETLVSQDTFIFSESLASNIAVAKPDASLEEIAQVVEQARLGDVIAQLDGGLDHVLTANGAELSEGQKQRVAVARAFLSEAPFLALDEPTSNMDALLEGQIIDALVSNQASKTYLIVSHRPAVLAHAQQLLTLSEGKLAPAQQ